MFRFHPYFVFKIYPQTLEIIKLIENDEIGEIKEPQEWKPTNKLSIPEKRLRKLNYKTLITDYEKKKYDSLSFFQKFVLFFGFTAGDLDQAKARFNKLCGLSCHFSIVVTWKHSNINILNFRQF